MANWITENYPVGQEVVVAGEGPGIIENHTCEKIPCAPGMRAAGIIVQLADNSRTEVEAEFLNEDGSDGPFVQKKK